MQQQSWVTTIAFAVIAFIGGYFAAWHGPSSGMGATPRDSTLDDSARCFFSPDGGCTRAVTAEIAAGQHSIQLQGFTFSSPEIASALMDAHRRGVDVKLLLDAGAAGDFRAQAQALVRAGIPVFVDGKHAAAHSKVILIDTRTLITGSFDFTSAAENDNVENVLILHDQARLQSAYADNFRAHLAHSEPFDVK
jgi:phosphatidylserine/phosphatidylglycerophosphate/cardiolipin synthase-like enzyme